MARRRAFGSIEKRGDKPGYYVRFRWNGRRIRRAAGPTKSVAQSKLSRAHALLEKGFSIEEVLAEVFGDVHGPQMNFQKSTDEYLKYAKGRKKESTYSRDVIRLRRICRASWTKKSLSDIQSRDLHRWLSEIQSTGLSGPTLNRYRSIISAVFKWALHLGYVQENPVKRVEAYSEAGREREVYLTADEARALIEAAEPLFKPLLMMALYTGARRGESLSLLWRDVDFERGEIVVQAAYSKTRKWRVIPIAEALQAELRALRESRKTIRVDGTDSVLVDRESVPIKPSAVRAMMDRAVRRCDAIPKDKKPEVTFHVLRHTFASLAAQNGVSFFELGKLLGHSTPAMTARYSHFYPEGARAAISRLGQVLAGPPSGPPAEQAGS
ncbi:MAG: tyrosine-type recombinase/integrase [Planctomycetota bacterium]|nr:tyrosine-type recombinase/integrase [Planctomycetota bacterium]